MNTHKNIIEKLADKKLTVSSSESCTGGLVSSELTSIAGSSAVFLGGVVAYSNDVKMSLLGVNEETLKSFGAVSEQTAKEMAVGVKKIVGSSIGVSTTGIAGPGGGSPEKPVGTVFVGVASGNEVQAYHLKLDGDRNQIRQKTVEFVMEKISELVS
jgi:PncC family amidohydrolase